MDVSTKEIESQMDCIDLNDAFIAGPNHLISVDFNEALIVDCFLLIHKS
jgi:hypothetical protein